MQELKSTWINMRDVFTGIGSPTFTIRLPASLFRSQLLEVHEMDRLIEITSMEMKQVFQPTMKKIIDLVLAQVHEVVAKEGKNPKVSSPRSSCPVSLMNCIPQYIILVGGFGRNTYLYASLTARSGGIEVLQSQGEEP